MNIFVTRDQSTKLFSANLLSKFKGFLLQKFLAIHYVSKVQSGISNDRDLLLDSACFTQQ